MVWSLSSCSFLIWLYVFVVGFLHEKPASGDDIFKKIRGSSGTDTLGAFKGFCGCLVLGGAWIPNYVRCLCWNFAEDSQGVPYTEKCHGRFLTQFLCWGCNTNINAPCAEEIFFWEGSWRVFCSAALLPEGASESLGGMLHCLLLQSVWIVPVVVNFPCYVSNCWW